MRKGLFTFTLDVVTYQEFMNIVGKGNLSREIENFMANTVAVERQDVTKIDIKILKNETSKLQKEISKLQAKLLNKTQLIDDFEQKQLKKEEKVLEKEKKKIKNAKKCIACNLSIGEKVKRHEFPKGFVCNNCYFAASNEDILGWK